MHTLVVNHMQGGVFPTVEPIIPRVVEELRRTIKLGGAIVVLEVDPDTKGLCWTDERIEAVLRDEAPRYERRAGWQEESAGLVQGAIEANQWPADTVRVVGVGTDSCMFSLVFGLSRLGFPRIEVVQDACNCHHAPDEDPWWRYPNLKNVVLLPAG